jgi:hypothetical protein
MHLGADDLDVDRSVDIVVATTPEAASRCRTCILDSYIKRS